MKLYTSYKVLMITLMILMLSTLSSLAAPGQPGVPGGGGGHKPTGGESAANNVSFPVIFSDNIRPAGWVDVTTWTSASITNTASQCVGENDIVPPATVPPDLVCYWGRENLGLDETTGEPILAGEPKLWWLQQRAQNKWQSFTTVDPDNTTKVVVTAIDFGDLLESAALIRQKQVRTEVTLLQDASLDPDFAAYLTTFPVSEPVPVPLTYFAAFKMSGAVPGTDQSQAEIQGTDFFDVADGSGVIDPYLVKGYDATVYTRCARLVIQKITGNPTWSSTDGYWVNGANTPKVNIEAYSDQYTAEINAGGNLIYGFNWNIKSQAEGAGEYRITFVIDGTSRCSVSNTVFDDTTIIANPGNINTAYIVPNTDPMLTAGEGGLAYIDVNVKVTGGGGGKGRGHNR